MQVAKVAVAAASNGAAGPEIQFLKAEGAMLPFVESYYLYGYDAPSIDGVDRVDIGQIRFMLEGSGTRSYPDGHTEPTCPVMINGPGLAAATYHIDGPFHCFGVSLRAIGWKAIVGLPAHKVSNRVVDAVEVFGPEVMGLLAQLQQLDSLAEMAAVVEPFLMARRGPFPRAHVPLVRAVREWAASGAGIEGLYERLDMSPRQATRLCNEYFGGPPKHLERKYRAIRAAMRIYQGEDVRDAAAPFADQAHMIKEVKQFTGHTPTTLRDAIDPILAVTLDNETFHFLPDVIPESVDVALD